MRSSRLDVVSGRYVTRDKPETRKAAARLIVSGVSGVSGEYIKAPATTPVPAPDSLPVFCFDSDPAVFCPRQPRHPRHRALLTFQRLGAVSARALPETK